MSDGGKRKPYLWPVIFLGAFVLGALLWALWMSHVIQETKLRRDSDFFVPTHAPAQQNQSDSTPPKARPSN